MLPCLAAEKRIADSWSPKVNSMTCLVPPDPDFVRLKRRLKRSRDNIRQSRSDFFSSPVVTRTPTPNELWQRRDRLSDTLWENEPHQIDRLSVPSICVTNNSASPMTISDREEDELDQSSSSLSLRYFSEDEGVELRRPSSQNLYAVPVSRSQSFQEQATYSSQDHPGPTSTSRFVVKRVVSDEHIMQCPPCQRSTAPARNYLHERGACRSTDDTGEELGMKPRMVSRLIAKMRRVTLDWRRVNRSRRGELAACVIYHRDNIVTCAS